MFPRGLLRELPGEGTGGAEGRCGAACLSWMIGVLPSPAGDCSALGSTSSSRRAVLPLSLAVGADLSLSIVFLCLGRSPATRVTCIAEAGRRAVPSGCRRL